MPRAANTAAKAISRDASLEATAPTRALIPPLLSRSGENGRRLRGHQAYVDQRRRRQGDTRRQRRRPAGSVRRVEHDPALVQVVRPLTSGEHGRRRPLGDPDLDPIREAQADLGGADPGKASQPGREGVWVDEEDGAIDGQGEGGPDLGGGQMAEAADTHLGGPEDGLGEDEEEEEDLPSQDGHLAEGPQPASYRGGTGPPGR